MTSEIHLFILWQRARYKENEILQDMEKHFSVLKRYAITWTPEMVSSNFTRFYGVNLPPKSGKELECGTGEFLLCVIRDSHPIYAERMTSRGPEVVNVNTFDAKERYRSWTGGGHKIHGTNSEKETNHDLTLLIGKNVADFLKENHPSEVAEVIQKDIEGATGWNSIVQLFYVLNNTSQYVILRGSENVIPKTHSDYEDTDILTTEYDNLWRIINGQAIYHHVRPKSLVIINERIYYLDIWDAHKNYYDQIWVQQMMNTAILWKNLRTLNPENNFYCLLYHCLTNKGNIADKHLPTLETYKKQFSIQETDWNKILVSWLSAKHYEIIEHSDPSNPFNLSNPTINQYALRFGKCIRVVQNISWDSITKETISWTSKVYRKEKSYVKAGTPWLIDNESRFLERIGDGIHFPKIIATGGDTDEHWIEISEIQGEELFENKWGIHIGDIRKYAWRIVELIEKLYSNNIIHRDISNSNILVSKEGNAAIIDFGFAIDFKEDKSYHSPWKLGLPYAPSEMFSDFYNLANLFEYRYGKMPYVKRFASELKRIGWETYSDSLFINHQINQAKEAIKCRFTLMDIFEFIMCKYKIHKYLLHPFKLFRRLTIGMGKPFSFMQKILKKVIRRIRKIVRL